MPLVRRGPVSPNNILEENKKGVRARQGLRAPCQRVKTEFGTVWRSLPQPCFAYTLF